MFNVGWRVYMIVAVEYTDILASRLFMMTCLKTPYEHAENKILGTLHPGTSPWGSVIA